MMPNTSLHHPSENVISYFDNGALLIKTLFHIVIVEAPLKQKLNLDVCVVW